MKEFTICSSIEAIDTKNKVIGFRLDTYLLDENGACCTDSVYRSLSYGDYKSVSEWIAGMSELNQGVHVTFSERALQVLRGLFAGELTSEEYTKRKPSLTITSYTLDSQSFEFTTDRGIYRVTEKHSVEKAYQELVLMLNDAGIDTSWIAFAR